MTGVPAVVLFMLAADLFTGRWKLNPEKSKLPPPVPKSQIAIIQIDGPDISIEEEVVGADDKRLNVRVKAKFGGKQYPVEGTPFADMVAYQRVNKRTISGTAWKDGRVVVLERVVVSRDGKVMTGTYRAVGESAKATPFKAVFDRQPDVSGK